MQTENMAAIVVAKTLVTGLLKNSPAVLERAGDCARYCQLLATKCKLEHEAARKLVLSAWLSFLPADSPQVQPLTAEEGIADILSPQNKPESAYHVAAEILDMVKTFLQLRDQAGDSHGALFAASRPFRRKWATTPERQLLERRFLQLLEEEAFLLRPKRSGAGHILIVDPQESVAPILSPPLIQQGFKVTCVDNVEDGRRAVREAGPDLILCEMDLPMDSGTDFCAELKKGNTADRPLPVILLTAKHRRQAIHEGLRAGADEVLYKPVDIEGLSLHITHLLGQRSSPKTTPAPEIADGALSGSLATVDFPDLIQILTASRRNVTITLHSSAGNGSMVLRNGSVIHAQTEGKSGEEAFYEMMCWKDARFTTSDVEFAGAPTIHTGVMDLLLSGAQRLDESAAIDPGDFSLLNKLLQE